MMDMVPVYQNRKREWKYGLLATRWRFDLYGVWASGWGHNKMDPLSETFLNFREVDYVIPREYLL